MWFGTNKCTCTVQKTSKPILNNYLENISEYWLISVIRNCLLTNDEIDKLSGLCASELYSMFT